ncbi:MAG: flagellar biosynthetic protein FliR [Myxococcota bacterium]
MEVILAKLGYALNYRREMILVALILGRTMPMLVLTPFLSGKLVPTQIKMGMGLLFTILLWPVARNAIDMNQLPVTAIPFFLMMLKEILIGFAIGFVNHHIFWAMEMAGRIIDTVRGSSMAEVMMPQSGTRATPFGVMFFQLMVVIFMVAGGHHIFIEAYFFSFARLPIDVGLAMGEMMEPFFDHMIRLTGDTIMIGALLAAPIVAATFITDVVFGILNRVAPQLNAYFMSMPVKAMAGVLMVLLILMPFVERLFEYVIWSLQAVERTIEFLAVAG